MKVNCLRKKQLKSVGTIHVAIIVHLPSELGVSSTAALWKKDSLFVYNVGSCQIIHLEFRSKKRYKICRLMESSLLSHCWSAFDKEGRGQSSSQLSGADPQNVELNGHFFFSLALIILGLNLYSYDLISSKCGKCWYVGFLVPHLLQW